MADLTPICVEGDCADGDFVDCGCDDCGFDDPDYVDSDSDDDEELSTEPSVAAKLVAAIYRLGTNSLLSRLYGAKPYQDAAIRAGGDVIDHAVALTEAWQAQAGSDLLERAADLDEQGLFNEKGVCFGLSAFMPEWFDSGSLLLMAASIANLKLAPNSTSYLASARLLHHRVLTDAAAAGCALIACNACRAPTIEALAQLALDLDRLPADVSVAAVDPLATRFWEIVDATYGGESDMSE